jgi:hypothetical protein
MYREVEFEEMCCYLLSKHTWEKKYLVMKKKYS